MPDNGPGRFRLIASDSIKESIRRLRSQAPQDGRFPAFREALKQIVEKLESLPLEAGEPVYPLHGMQLQLRTIVIRPIAVRYGVHQDRPLVVIQSVQLLAQ